MPSYCTEADAKSAGATGSTQEIADAIAEASDRVDRYTGDTFAPTAKTLELVVGGDGQARVGRRIQSITSVTWYGATSPIVATAYRVSSSKTGGRDVISLYGDLSWADVTVLGAEPWAGGFANLSRSAEPRVVVVGVFGWDAPPRDVVRATAMIAAQLRRDDAVTDETNAGNVADTEGNVIPVVPPFDDAADDRVAEIARVRNRTTGVLQADALLASYVREPVRMRA